jgi:hypothetical protein
LRTQATCRLHVALRELIAGGAPRRLGADRAAKLLRNIHPLGAAGVERKRLAVELLADVGRLDRDIATAKRRVADAVTASGTSLLELHPSKVAATWRVRPSLCPPAPAAPYDARSVSVPPTWRSPAYPRLEDPPGLSLASGWVATSGWGVVEDMAGSLKGTVCIPQPEGGRCTSGLGRCHAATCDLA